MRQAAAELNFEEAARLRDRMVEVKSCFWIWNSLGTGWGCKEL